MDEPTVVAVRGRRARIPDVLLFDRLHPHAHDFLIYPLEVVEENTLAGDDDDDDLVSQIEGEEDEGDASEWITWITYPETPDEFCSLREYLRELRAEPLHVAVSEWIRLLALLLTQLAVLADHGVHVHPLLADTTLCVSRASLTLFLPCRPSLIALHPLPLPPVAKWPADAAVPVAADIAQTARRLDPVAPGPALLRAAVDKHLRKHALPHVFPAPATLIAIAAAHPSTWYPTSVAAIFKPYATPIPLIQLCNQWLLPDCTLTPTHMLQQLNQLIIP